MGKSVINTIIIQAPAKTVWDVLVNPDHTQKYMFGCKTISDWKVGSSLAWKMIHEGKEMIPVKGVILESELNRRLKYTVIDPYASYPDIPENHLNVLYALEEKDGGTSLTVTQDGFEGAADGEKRYQDVYNKGEGWNPILVQIKAIAEKDKE